MAKCCACSLTPILAFAGLLGLGAAGYRVADGGCLMCHDTAKTAQIIPASDHSAATGCPMMSHEQMGHTKLVGAEDGSGCCAGMSAAECEAKMSECPAHSGCCEQVNKAKLIAAPEKVASTGK